MLVAIRNMFYVLVILSCIAVCNKDGFDKYHLSLPIMVHQVYLVTKIILFGGITLSDPGLTIFQAEIKSH